MFNRTQQIAISVLVFVFDMCTELFSSFLCIETTAVCIEWTLRV